MYLITNFVEITFDLTELWDVPIILNICVHNWCKKLVQKTNSYLFSLAQ